MQIQTFDSSIVLVKKHFEKFSSASVSSVFNRLRGQARVSFVGDYPLIALIVTTMFDLNLRPHRNRVLRAFNKSNELRVFSKSQKTMLLNQLFESEMAKTKRVNIDSSDS